MPQLDRQQEDTPHNTTHRTDTRDEIHKVQRVAKREGEGEESKERESKVRVRGREQVVYIVMGPGPPGGNP